MQTMEQYIFAFEYICFRVHFLAIACADVRGVKKHKNIMTKSQ